MEITQRNGKAVSASRVTIAQLVQPENANSLGNLHGGWILKLMDEAGTLACMRQAYRLALSKRREAKYG